MYYEPFIGQATVAVLEHNGASYCRLRNCCGLPLLSNGEFDEAEKYHDNNVNKTRWIRTRWIRYYRYDAELYADVEKEAPGLLDKHDADSTDLKWQYGIFLNGSGTMGEGISDRFSADKHDPPYHAPCQYCPSRRQACA